MKKALLLLAVAAMVAACHDDKDDNDSSTDQNTIVAEDGKIAPVSLTTDEEHLLDQQQAIFNILSSLTDIDLSKAGRDLLGNTYRPTYGDVRDESQPLVRSVRCETSEDAQKLFCGIVNTDTLLTTTSDGLQITLKDMPLMPNGDKVSFGTLTFHKGDGSQSVGYVDVDVKCIPSLQRIDFVPESAWGDNAASDTPYRVGDIVCYYPPNASYCTGYYLCVAQSTNGAKNGLLVHLCQGELGGDETINLDGDSKGCWKPYNNDHGFTATATDCSQYIGFLATKKELVKKIKKYLNGEMTKKPSREGKLWHVMPGGFNNNSGVVFTTSANARWIIYDAWYGDYAWVPAYDYRHFAYYRVPNNCTSDAQCWSDSKKYVYDGDFQATSDKDYTINVIRFANEKIDGATLEYSAMTDVDE